ncbi:MAG: DUF6754 domain-containing protein [Anaerolineae bacterium]
MGNQLIALGFVLVGAMSLALFSLQRRRESQEQHVTPVFQAFEREVGRVAEEGAAIHVALGSGGLLDEKGMVSVAALHGLSGMLELSAAYDTPPYITTGDATLFLLAENRLRDAYARLGDIRNYTAGSVRFVAPTPVLYAAMAATLSSDEALGTSISLGAFDQEVSLLTHAATRRGTTMFGGAVTAPGLAALYPDLDDQHLVMGEELFTAGAEILGRPTFWGGLKAENLLRWLVIVGIVAAIAASLLGIGG